MGSQYSRSFLMDERGVLHPPRSSEPHPLPLALLH